MTKLSCWLDRQALIGALDAIPTSLVLFDFTGKPVKANLAATRILCGPDGTPIRSVLEEFAGHLCQLVEERGQPIAEGSAERAVREVQVGERRYCLRGSYIRFSTPADGGALLVSLEHFSIETPPDEILRERFRLTKREVRIARMLVERRTNLEIARDLFISPNTARTHTQRILQKLGVRSRAEVAAKILHEKRQKNT